MPPVDIQNIKTILEQMDFVRWDRFVKYRDSKIDRAIHHDVYGWIERDDGKFDFILVFFRNYIPDGFYTSSKKYTHEINKIIGFPDEDHIDCERVEDILPELKNCIKLKEGK